MRRQSHLTIFFNVMEQEEGVGGDKRVRRIASAE